MQRLSITKGHAFILVYSVCSRQSLEEIRPIWALIKEIKAENLSSIPVMLGELLILIDRCWHRLTSCLTMYSVGNKIDESAELREVTHAEGQAQAAEWAVQFMETSAKTNHNVTELFQVRIVLQFPSKSPLTGDLSLQELLNMEKNRNVSLTDNKSNKKKGKSKKKEQNGSAGTSGEGGSGGGKEKCQVM